MLVCVPIFCFVCLWGVVLGGGVRLCAVWCSAIVKVQLFASILSPFLPSFLFASSGEDRRIDVV